MSKCVPLTEFWFGLSETERSVLAALCAVKMDIPDRAQLAHAVLRAVGPGITEEFEGFGEGINPLLVPVREFLLRNSNATYGKVFAHLIGV